MYGARLMGGNLRALKLITLMFGSSLCAEINLKGLTLIVFVMSSFEFGEQHISFFSICLQL